MLFSYKIFSRFLSFKTNFISQNPPSPTENPPLSTQNPPPHNRKTTKTPPPTPPPPPPQQQQQQQKNQRSKRERLRDWGKDCGWIGFCRGWVGGVWIRGEVTRSDWVEGRSDWVEGGSEVKWVCQSETEGGSDSTWVDWRTVGRRRSIDWCKEHRLEEEHELGCRTVTCIGVSCSVEIGFHWAWSVRVRSLRECVRGVNDF